jgi:hypothetical protein
VFGFPLYVFFLSMYSILSFLASNLAQVNLDAANRLIAWFLIGTLTLLLLARLFSSGFARAGAVVLPFLIIFYSYGHVKNLLRDYAHPLARNVILLPIAIGLFLGALFLVLRLSQSKLRQSVPYLNLVSLLLLIFPVVSIIGHEFRIASYLRVYRAKVESNSPDLVTYRGNLPDVYFIILDGYARSDVLQQELGLDNSEFLQGLRQQGFYVADCSMSNYASTEQSLATTLNMEYLEEMLARVPDGKWAEDYFAPWIQHSQVRRFFESLSYRTVSFYTGYYWAQWIDSTYFMSDPRLEIISQESTTPEIGFLATPFEKAYTGTTLLLSLIEIYQELIPVPKPEVTFLNGITGERAIVLFPLNNLQDIAKLEGPKFVFLHLLLPHPPYVFGPNGEEREIDTSDVQARLRAYSDQVLFADSRILPLVDGLITQTDGNVIIIMEGDHGLIDYQEHWTRMANLSAYYFPDQDYSALYPQITPVNSFRVLLTQYFGQNLPLLKDVSNFSPTSADKTFELIPNPCAEK